MEFPPSNLQSYPETCPGNPMDFPWISRGLESPGTRPFWTCPPRAIHPPWALGPFLVPLRTDPTERNGSWCSGISTKLGEKGDKVLPVLDQFIESLLVYSSDFKLVYWCLLKVYWFMFLGSLLLFGFRIARFPGTGSRNAGLCSAGLVWLRQLWAGDTVQPACWKIIRKMGRTCWVWCKLMQIFSLFPQSFENRVVKYDHSINGYGTRLYIPLSIYIYING